MVGASVPAPPELVNYELKDILSSISEDEVERFMQLYELSDNISFRRLEEKKGSLNGMKGEVAVHTASLEADLQFLMLAGFSRKWLFVSGDWEGVYMLVTSLKGQAMEFSTELASKARLVGHLLMVESRSFNPTGSRENAPKSRKVGGSSSRSVIPSRLASSMGIRAGQTSTSRVSRSKADRELSKHFQAERSQAPPPRPTSEGLGALMSAPT
ncbi:hypothetical protein FNV43_RR19103 [Rhamnella rubrinervis]|uniref:Uncharacterized protein n=1 Tax=Rhamnella rubrinervis TaxID=2594499 RepID=A0A8K0GTJ1_9ROSA|nr:hypothetical protein FNV43_RR19103 [Rhamnella rubrinervis]